MDTGVLYVATLLLVKNGYLCKCCMVGTGMIYLSKNSDYICPVLELGKVHLFYHLKLILKNGSSKFEISNLVG